MLRVAKHPIDEEKKPVHRDNFYSWCFHFCETSSIWTCYYETPLLLIHDVSEMMTSIPTGSSGAPTSEYVLSPTIASVAAPYKAMSDQLEHLSRR
ncbi:hypothetical protein RDI58_010706 [Solanum bulbocastanum]|uniref:Uncharacterized protein n=1 Tax=Solanum bulbocastanum TaxID=147425 RepID=A0AAN8TR17_SOLBU